MSNVLFDRLFALACMEHLDISIRFVGDDPVTSRMVLDVHEIPQWGEPIGNCKAIQYNMSPGELQTFGLSLSDLTDDQIVNKFIELINEIKKAHLKEALLNE